MMNGDNMENKVDWLEICVFDLKYMLPDETFYEIATGAKMQGKLWYITSEPSFEMAKPYTLLPLPARNYIVMQGFMFREMTM